MRICRRTWIWCLALSALLALAACGPAPSHSSSSTTSTGNPGGGSTTSTAASTATPTATAVPPTDTPAPSVTAFTGVWNGALNLGGSTTSIHVAGSQCGTTVFASFTFGGATVVAFGMHSGQAATLSDVAYHANAPVDDDTWTLTLVNGGTALAVKLTRHALAGGSQTGSGTVSVSATSVPSATNFAGTWNGNETVSTGDQFPIRFAIAECGPFLHADITLSVGGSLPSMPQSHGNAAIANGKATVESTYSVSAGLYEYDRWVLTLPSANDLHFTDFTHYLYPGNTTPDQNASGDLSK
jgi:hypothetical protein